MQIFFQCCSDHSMSTGVPLPPTPYYIALGRWIGCYRETIEVTLAVHWVTRLHVQASWLHIHCQSSIPWRCGWVDGLPQCSSACMHACPLISDKGSEGHRRIYVLTCTSNGSTRIPAHPCTRPHTHERKRFEGIRFQRRRTNEAKLCVRYLNQEYLDVWKSRNGDTSLHLRQTNYRFR